MRNYAVIFVLMVTLMLTQMLWGQEQFTLTGNGARAAGMGYAFTGVADDATAISWNSAGLTQLYSMEASVIGTFNFGSIGTDYIFDDVETSLSSPVHLNFASFIVPFQAGKTNIAAGISYRTLYDFYQTLEWSYSDNSSETSEENGGVSAISPAVAVQINDMLSVGAVVNILGGSWESIYTATWQDGEDRSESDFSGTSVDVGVLVKPSPVFSIGANFYLPYTLTETVKGQNGGMDVAWDVNVPFFFALGLMYRASDNLSLAADYRHRPWSGSELYIDGQMQDYWELQDANSFHVGLEYLIQSGKAVVPVRLGFYTLPTPAAAYDYVNDAEGDQISYNALTAGLGLVMGKFILDGSFEYQFGSYIADYDFDDMGNIQNIEYSLSNFKVTVGATIHLGD